MKKWMNNQYNQIVKSLEFINKIKLDNRLHSEIGMMIGFISILFFNLLGIEFFPVLIIVCLSGVMKEVFDKFIRDIDVDTEDIIYTVYGGIIPQIIQILFYILTQWKDLLTGHM